MNLNTARVFVRDIALARRFYAEALGLKPHAQDLARGWCVFNAGNSELVLEAVPADAAAERQALLEALPELPGEVLFVANEIGLGIVPLGEETRRFRDEAGRLNQDLAAACERATFVAAGLPLPLKT